MRSVVLLEVEAALLTEVARPKLIRDRHVVARGSLPLQGVCMGFQARLPINPLECSSVVAARDVIVVQPY